MPFWSSRVLGKWLWISLEIKKMEWAKNWVYFFVVDWTITSGGSRGGPKGGPPPPIIFRPNWGPKGRKKFLLPLPPPPPLSEGLDPPLITGGSLIISSSLWSGVTSCSNIIIKNAEIKFKHRTTKINFKRTDGKLLLLEISISRMMGSCYKSKKIKNLKALTVRQ